VKQNSRISTFQPLKSGDRRFLSLICAQIISVLLFFVAPSRWGRQRFFHLVIACLPASGDVRKQDFEWVRLTHTQLTRGPDQWICHNRSCQKKWQGCLFCSQFRRKLLLTDSSFLLALRVLIKLIYPFVFSLLIMFVLLGNFTAGKKDARKLVFAYKVYYYHSYELSYYKIGLFK